MSDYVIMILEAEVSNPICCAKHCEYYFSPLGFISYASEDGNWIFTLTLQWLWSNWLTKYIKLRWRKIYCGSFICIHTTKQSAI